MAGTLPHAVFVETGIDEVGQVMAFAGELPGCASVGSDADAAVASVPAQVTTFVGWLRSFGEALTEPVGNWYEVERVAAGRGAGDVPQRAAFSLDELPPSVDEFATWLRWAELAREELAAALDRVPLAADRLTWLAAQDERLAAELNATSAASSSVSPASEDALDRLYATRDALMAALAVAGPSGAGVRRALRLAIADDLRATELISAR